MTPKPPLEFEQAFQLLYARAFEEYPAKEQVAEEQLRGRGLWSELVASDHDARLAAVESDRRFHTWGFFDTLLEEARGVGRRDPEEAVRLASLALVVHPHLEPERYTAAMLADFEGEALGILGNARRLAADFAGAAPGLHRGA